MIVEEVEEPSVAQCDTAVQSLLEKKKCHFTDVFKAFMTIRKTGMAESQKKVAGSIVFLYSFRCCRFRMAMKRAVFIDFFFLICI
jgi:hypothetical protein